MANPGGEQSWLMGDVCAAQCQQLDLTFEDGPFPAPVHGAPLASVTYRPSSPSGTLDATAAPPTTALSLMDLADPGSSIAGDWLLFIYDTNESGIVAPPAIGAWSLTFKGISASGSNGGGGGPGSTSGTPEPAALLLALAALAALAGRRPRHR